MSAERRWPATAGYARFTRSGRGRLLARHETPSLSNPNAQWSSPYRVNELTGIPGVNMEVVIFFVTNGRERCGPVEDSSSASGSSTGGSRGSETRQGPISLCLWTPAKCQSRRRFHPHTAKLVNRKNTVMFNTPSRCFTRQEPQSCFSQVSIFCLCGKQ